MIAIIDYGVGNLFSLKSSFAAIGEEAVVTSDPEVLRKADKLILPGVGAFGDAAEKLRAGGLADEIREIVAGGKPLMGICLGMQMLFERSYEYGVHEGLGLIKGEVRPIEGVITPGLKIPHIGWNALHFKGAGSAKNGECMHASDGCHDKHPVFKYINEGDCVYFVHSFAGFDCEESLIATAEYGAELTAAVASGNVIGCQFHPEKSGEVGLKILKAFCEM